MGMGCRLVVLEGKRKRGANGEEIVRELKTKTMRREEGGEIGVVN